MKKVIVLGAGLVGSAIAKDLQGKFEVTSADIHEEALGSVAKHGIRTIKADLRDDNTLRSIIRDQDLVIGAVPGFMGFNTAMQVILEGKNMVDISFFPEDPFELDSLAREKNVVVVTDCGVAPGMGNIILGHHNRHMKVVRYECLVGGLPVVREWPWEYKAVFSPADVIEEYVRPARYVQNGSVVVREALSDTELIPFPGLGTLESWNSDGLRSLIRTMPHIPDMIEKTLRYPGCVEYLRVLRSAGFFSTQEIEVNGTRIRPLDLTSRLLFSQWKLKPGEEDFTIMRIVIEGEEHNTRKVYTYHLLDRFDQATQTISMARTTGYTCTSVANLVMDGRFARTGINPPEMVGDEPGCYEYVIEYLRDRGVHYTIS